MENKLILVIISVLLALAFSAGAEALPHDFTFNPTSGLITVPAARTLASNQYKLAFYTIFMDERPEGVVAGDDNEPLLMGLPWGGEIGANILNSNLVVSMNLQWVFGADWSGSWVLGGQNIFGVGHPDPIGAAGAVFNYRADPSFYLATSGLVLPKLALTLGLGNGRFKGLFGGLEYFLSDDFTFLVDNAGEGFNCGLTYAVRPFEFGIYYVNWAGSSGLKSFPAISVGLNL